MIRVGPTGDFKIQAGEFLLDTLRTCRGSLEETDHEDRSGRKMNPGACLGSKGLGTAFDCEVMTGIIRVGVQ